MLVSPAYAQAADAAPGIAGSLMQFAPLLMIFAIMYLLMIRPQQKKMKAHRAMVEALKKGDQVITQGGVIGKVTAAREDELEVEIAQGVRIRVVRGTVAQVVTRTAPVAANA